MGSYLYDLKIAAAFFPLVALLVSIPFILIEYHKYGSVSLYKSIVFYSIVLYIMCAYFLIILPLPERSEVLKLTTPVLQLIPFNFIWDIIKHFTFTWSFFKSSYLYVPLFNILLTFPFGMYLRYCFHCNKKQTIIYTALLSLFFELTQLSGLYFIYPRAYRLCDIDDIILNTLGGLGGYYIIGLFSHYLPSWDKVNEKSIISGLEVSGFRRMTSLLLDVMNCVLLFIIISIFVSFKYLLLLVVIGYFVVIPLLMKGSTLAQKWLKLKVVDYHNNYNIIRTIFRFILFILIYIITPMLLLYVAFLFYKTENMLVICLICLICILVGIFYVVGVIKYAFTKKMMFYEKISKTKLISTIKYRDYSNK